VSGAGIEPCCLCVIADAVTLFSNCWEDGPIQIRLGPGRYVADYSPELKILLAPNTPDGLSSLIIPDGWRVVLYDDDKFLGVSLEVKPGSSDALCLVYANIPGGFNDRAGSLIIYGPGTVKLDCIVVQVGLM
jgi:hypothetical protein